MSRIELDRVRLDYPVYESRYRSLRHRLVQSLPVGGRFAEGDGGKGLAVRALSDVSLSIGKGDRLALVGHNGAGKSSLLRLIAGVYEPTAGRIVVDGRVSPIFGVGLGMDQDLTGRENIRLRGMVLGLSPKEIEARMEEIAAFSELGDFLDVPLRTYSSGMHLRLAFAVSTSIDPDILLLDEWIGAGDQAFLEKARARLLDLVGKANILVVASHRLSMLTEICNRAVLLEHGQLVEEGAVESIVERYRKPPKGTVATRPAVRKPATPPKPAAAPKPAPVAKPVTVPKPAVVPATGKAPDFLGIGAQKCGSTWLYQHLRGHPGIFFPPNKEIHYWDRNRSRGRDWYERHFSEAKEGQRKGEITPAYAILPRETIVEVQSAYPDLRLIYIIRNPVERAWSAACMMLPRAEMTLDEASDSWFIDHFRSGGSTQRSDYEACLRNWFASYPPERILLILYDDLVTNPAAILHQCYAHIGVSACAHQVTEQELRQKVFEGPGYPLRPSLRRYLTDMYAPKIDALEKFIGRDLGAWRAANEAALSSTPQLPQGPQLARSS